jgi:WD40 repeat protein
MCRTGATRNEHRYSSSGEAFVVARDAKTGGGWCNDGKVRMWNLPTGQMVRSFELNGTQPSRVISQVLLSPDGRWLLVGDSNGGVHVWDSASGELRFETALVHYFDTGAFSRDGNMIAITALESQHRFSICSRRGASSSLLLTSVHRWP